MAEAWLVVLGAGVLPGGVASATLRRRTEHGVSLFLGGGYDRLVVSGGVGRNPPAEADVMADIALAAGVPDGAIVRDRAAHTTIDTARFVASRVDPAAPPAITAVTDLYHAPRTRLAFAAYRLHATTSAPPLGHATRRWRLLWSFAREVPAMALYLWYFVRLRASR